MSDSPFRGLADVDVAMIERLGVVVVCAAGAYLVALGFVALSSPGKASRYLLGFASTRTLHLAELLARVVVGAAFVTVAPRMPLPQAFEALGWILLGTSTLLLCMPWQWHRRFADRTVPSANRHLTSIGLSSLLGGGLILGSVLHGLLR